LVYLYKDDLIFVCTPAVFFW